MFARKVSMHLKGSVPEFRRTIEEILARLKSEKFNSLEITRVASEASKRFLGVRLVTVSAQSRHIQGPARSAAA